MQGEALTWKMKYEDQKELQNTLRQAGSHAEEVHIVTVKAQLQAAEEIQEKLQVCKLLAREPEALC